MTTHPGLLRALVFPLLAPLLLAGCSTGPPAVTRVQDPAASVTPSPDYTSSCSPSGRDGSLSCIQVELQAIDHARAREHVRAMELPANFDKLTDAQQLFIALNRERVDRGLPAFLGLSVGLDALAQLGAAAGRLPDGPGQGFTEAKMEWIGDVVNPLDALYAWVYQGGPGSDGCDKAGAPGCWADRHLVLQGFASTRGRVMGAALDPTGDSTTGDVGGTSLAVILAASADPGTLAYTWTQAQADTAAGTLRPRNAPPADASATRIADPPRTVPPSPNFTQVCAPSGLDSSQVCVQAALEATNSARAREGVKPMVLPGTFGQLTIPQQIFVAVNLERADRGLRPFAGLTEALNRNAQQGADIANDPPDAGDAYDVADGEWAGGASNGLDAVYGWMYDDGTGSGNLDCPKAGGPGCWGHRHGILDDFGSVGTLVMGAALNATGDTGDDRGGPSMAATLAVTRQAVGPFTYTWTPPPPLLLPK